MGQSSSSEMDFEILKDKVQKKASLVKEIISLDYDGFKRKVDELNNIAIIFEPSEGCRLSFLIREKSDETMFWKPTVRIACVRINNQTNRIVSHKVMNLHQFLQAYNMFVNYANMQSTSLRSSSSRDSTFEVLHPHEGSKDEEKSEQAQPVHPVTTSYIMERISGFETDASIEDECCICMERKTEVMLPCTHSYCLACLEQWNDSSKTCPICRGEVKSEDTWVISEAPDSGDIAAEVQKAMTGSLAQTGES